MISYISGEVAYINETSVVVDVSGIGYEIFLTPVNISRLTIGEKAKLHTFMNVKDDGISLFGFYSKDELSLFNKLITVNGVGPKGALSFLTTYTPEDIILFILCEDTKSLSKVSGVGAKTAQRVILELKDKFKNMETIKSSFEYEETSSNKKMETIEALVSLGYTKTEAATVVQKIYNDDLETEELLKLALKLMI